MDVTAISSSTSTGSRLAPEHCASHARRAEPYGAQAPSRKGGDKATWIKRGSLKTFARYPKVKAMMYLDTDKPHLNVSHLDWRLVKPKDGSSVVAYRALAANPRFQGRIR